MMQGKILILVLSLLCLVQFGSTITCWSCSTGSTSGGTDGRCPAGDSGAFTIKCLAWVGQYTIPILVFNNARALLFGLVNVCAFLNKPRLISLTLQI